MGIIVSECPNIICKEIFPKVNSPSMAVEVPGVDREDIKKVKQSDVF